MPAIRRAALFIVFGWTKFKKNSKLIFNISRCLTSSINVEYSTKTSNVFEARNKHPVHCSGTSIHKMCSTLIIFCHMDPCRHAHIMNCWLLYSMQETWTQNRSLNKGCSSFFSPVFVTKVKVQCQIPQEVPPVSIYCMKVSQPPDSNFEMLNFTAEIKTLTARFKFVFGPYS